VGEHASRLFLSVFRPETDQIHRRERVITEALESIWTKKPETARRVKQRIERVIQWVKDGMPLPMRGARKRVRHELEGMMAAQLIAAQNAAMECYRRAMIPEQSFQGRRENLNQANKLSRTYATLLEALNRHRGKGQQKVRWSMSTYTLVVRR
jgi:hypothetical protein